MEAARGVAQRVRARCVGRADAMTPRLECVGVCVCVSVRAPSVYLCIGGPAGPGCCGQYEASAGGRGPAAVAGALR